MYFSLILTLAACLFLFLLVQGISRRDPALALINVIAIVCLAMAQIFDLLHWTSREELAALGVCLFAITIVNIHLLRRHQAAEEAAILDRLEKYHVRIDQEALAGALIESPDAFLNAYQDWRSLNRSDEMQRRLGIWRDAFRSIAAMRLEEAIEQFRTLDELAPNAVVKLNIAALLVETKQFNDALRYLRAARACARFWQYHFNLALVRMQQGNRDLAAATFKKLAQEERSNWKIATTHARLLRTLGQHETAANLLQRAADLKPDRYEPWYYLSLCQSKSGNQHDALASLDQALQRNRNDATIWYNRGNVLMRLGRFRDAVQSYDKAIERNPGYKIAWNNKGIALTKLGQLHEAIACYRKALSFNSKYHEALLNCAIAYESLGWQQEARQYYSRFVQHAPQALASLVEVVRAKIESQSAAPERADRPEVRAA